MEGELLDRDLAETYAGWFRTLADPTRVQILHLIASAGRPLPVGEVVERVHIGQSTVSHHLAVLAASRFVLIEPAGTARLYRVNEACLTCFPSAADVVMGRVPETVPEEVGHGRRAR
ncbi:MAG TPA: metalloregulator ArsR/SmtB family transcription factor [Mycobacteriales bacterium]